MIHLAYDNHKIWCWSSKKKLLELDEIKAMIQQVSSDLSAKLERLDVSITDRIRVVVQEQINIVVSEITEKFASLEARVTALEK